MSVTKPATPFATAPKQPNLTIPKVKSFGEQTIEAVKNIPFPTIGMIAGAAIGSAYNAFIGGKGGPVCKTLRASPLLSTINFLKQQEIKTFALLTPAACGLAYGLCKIFSKQKNHEGELLTLKEKAKNFAFKDVAKSVALTGGLIATNALFKAYAPKDFDPSGHVMLTAATSYAMHSVLSGMKNTGLRKTAATVGALIGFSNLAFIGNTAACYHTVQETLAGGVIALGAAQIINQF